MTFPKRRTRAPLVLASTHNSEAGGVRIHRKPATASPRASCKPPRRTSVCYRCLYSGPATQSSCPSCGFVLIAAERTAAGERGAEWLILSSGDRVHLPGVHPPAGVPRAPWR